MAYDWKYGRVSTERGTIEHDEPVFVIRGRDLAAPDAIDAYAEAAAKNGAGVDITDVCHERADAIREWQRDHPEVLKIPSTEPGQIVRES